MSSEFWGMTAFFISTVILSITTQIYAYKLAQTRRLLNQLQEKEFLNQSHQSEEQQRK